jgi:hypothetical protein
VTTPDSLPPAKKPNGCLTLILVPYVLFMSMLLLGAICSSAAYVSPFILLPVLLLCFSVPFVMKKKLQIHWPKRYLVALTVTITVVVMVFLDTYSMSSPAYDAYRKKMDEQVETQHQEVNLHTEQTVEATVVNPVSTYRIGDSFKTGYTRYQVNGIQWKTRLGDAYFGKTADARYLLVNVQIKNEDRENRMIQNFTLVDEQGATYDETADRMYLGDKSLFLNTLNPGVQKRAVLVFDVPPDHHYQLVLSGGYWTDEDARVQLN